MPTQERIALGSIFFAYQARPAISTEGTITGSSKDVVNMEWLNAEDLSVSVNTGPTNQTDTLAPFICISIHEHHVVALPLIKVPYTLNFNKTCELAERTDRTYLAIDPSENMTKLPSKRVDQRFRTLKETNFPEQKIVKDPKTGKDMPVWDTYIDLLNSICIHERRIEWHAEIYNAPLDEAYRLVRLFRFVHTLTYDIRDTELYDDDALSYDIPIQDQTIKRPREMMGPGVRQSHDGNEGKVNDGYTFLPPTSKGTAKGSKKDTSTDHKAQGQSSKGTLQGPTKTTWAQVAAPGDQKAVNKTATNQNQTVNLTGFGDQKQGKRHPKQHGQGRGWRGRKGHHNGRRNRADETSAPPPSLGKGTTIVGLPEAGCGVDKLDITAYLDALHNTAKRKGKQFIEEEHERLYQNYLKEIDGETWNKERTALVSEPWPEEWKILEPGERMIEGLESTASREGWFFQQPNLPWWTKVQDWLGLKGDDRIYKGWEYEENEDTRPLM